jgi:predicted helicase
MESRNRHRRKLRVADAFAQMLVYGLFLAKLNAKPNDKITLENARTNVPGSFRLIRELVSFLDELEKDEYVEIRWVIEEVLLIVNELDIGRIHEDLSFRGRKAFNRNIRARDEEEHRLFERDPFIYFYEDFLRSYEKATSKSRGVYYTPPPVVNFIVRAVDDILKSSFGIDDGLADSRRVTVLDFACGTGTFLLEVFQRIFDNIGGPQSGKAGKVVTEHILQHLYGFEYLLAPYTIAHLKLSQYLNDKGHPLKGNERLQVFLTNTLEPVMVEPDQAKLWPVPALATEIREADAVKKKQILVITGNPPYSGHSKNEGFKAEIGGYKYTIEKDEQGREVQKPLGERNPKWLNDDYVKFIRFAQLKMDAVEEGVVGIITNHSWLDNPTFRGMRQSLMRSFEQIYVLDLHGNAKKKERAPDGGKDENVFDIEQGVAISLFVKKPGLERGVWRGDLWGKRIEKYKNAAETSCSDVVTQPISPRAPDYLFLTHQEDAAYSAGWPLTAIFEVNGAGIVTAHDEFSIAFDEATLRKRFDGFRRARGNADDLYREFDVARKEGWDILKGWKSLRESSQPTSAYIKPIAYGPFDSRYIFYEDALVWRTVHRIMDNLDGENVVLLSSRITKDEPSALVTNSMYRHKVATRYDISYGFLLYVGGAENLSPDFRTFLDARYEHHYLPQQILGYIYAVLHAPTYRARYAEFLRIDFPRIPFPECKADFEALSALGWELVQTHLLKSIPALKLAELDGKGSDTVEAVRYSPQEQAIWFNKTQCFKPVPQDVWDFHIGGYPVLEKYLKSRKTRELSLAEIEHVRDIARALSFTIAQMAMIDATYTEAFGH